MPEPVSMPTAGWLPAEYYDHNDSINVCYHCGNPRYQPICRVTHFGFPFTFYRCQCGLIKQAPMPNERFFDWFFNSEVFFSSKRKQEKHIWGYYDYFADEPNRLATSRHRYRKLARWFERQPSRIMKIGPGTGTFLHVAQQHGHVVRGCDVSSRFLEFARKTYGVPIDHGRFERQPYSAEQFDVIMLLNVIENVPNQVEFLSAIQRTLRRGGYFILNYVEMRANLMAWLQGSKYFLYRPPVCYAYTGRVLQSILQQFGFEVVHVLRDIRVMNVEKIVTLLGWPTAHRLARMCRLHRLSLPIYAYPSKIVVARRGTGM